MDSGRQTHKTTLESDPPSRSNRFTIGLLLVGLVTASMGFANGQATSASSGEVTPWIPFAVFLAAGLGAMLFRLVQIAVAHDAPDGNGVKGRSNADSNGASSGNSADDWESERAFERLCWGTTLFFQLVSTVAAVRLGISLLQIADVLAAFLGGGVAVVLLSVLLEGIIPTIGLNRPGFVRRWVARPARLAVAPLLSITKLLLRLLRGREVPVTPAGYRLVRERELRLLTHVRGVDRLVEEDAADMIDSVREFAEATAREVMTPRTDIEGVPRSIEKDELIDRLRAAEYSRLVVYGQNLDDIQGVLLAKEILLNRPEDPFELMRKPIFVSRDARLPDLLRRLRHAPSYMAVVLDEYGGTAGILTLHDLFERVIGEHIADAEEEEELWIDKQGDDMATISGRVEVWEINQELGLELDESVARTLGGYLMYRFGRLPEAGESWIVDGGAFRVLLVENNRIQSVEFQRNADAREQLNPVEEPVP